MRSVIEQFENYSKLNKKLPAETAVQLAQLEDASKLADAVAANTTIKVSDKQALLAELNPVRRLELAFAFMEGGLRSEEHRSELHSLMRNSYAVFRLHKKSK